MPNLSENVYIRPTLQGMMRESPHYQVLGVGLTDRVFLLGHADGLSLNDPHQVVDIQEAVNLLGADAVSPLLRGLLEAYYGGARDIWIMAVAPMSEYTDDPTLRNSGWYTTYRNRLQAAYDMLSEWDLVQILVPLTAPYYDAKGIDFLTPLATHCAGAFAVTGTIRIGLIGTQTGPITQAAVTAMATDVRRNNIGEDGKFVSIIVGEGVFNNREMPTAYTNSLVTAAAAELSQLPYNRGLTHRTLPNIMSLSTQMTLAQLTQLTDAKLNPIALSTLGERGIPFQTVILTDNTLGVTGTDYWSIVQVRLVLHVIDMVRALARRYLGTIGYGSFRQEVGEFFQSLLMGNTVRDYSLNISRDLADPYKVLVDIAIKPYFGIRQINFVVDVGPSN